jgi:hypothetical protein
MIVPGRFVLISNEAENISCRQLFQEDVRPGKTIPIPDSLGRRKILLDDTGMIVQPVAGVVYALLEENGTTDSLMTKGHQVFGQALDDEINDFIRKNGLPPPPLSEADRVAMAERIQDRVTNAIEDAASWTEYFRSKDRVIGFASEFFDWPALSVMRDGAPGQPFPIPRTIRKERLVQTFGTPFPGLVVAVDEFEIRGTIQVSRMNPSDRCQDLRDGYNRVGQLVKDSEAALQRLREEYAKASEPRKLSISQEIRKTRAEKEKALQAVERAHDAYRACRAEDPTRTRGTPEASPIATKGN